MKKKTAQIHSAKIEVRVARAALKALSLFYSGQSPQNTDNDCIPMDKSAQSSALFDALTVRNNTLKRQEQIKAKLDKITLQLNNFTPKVHNSVAVSPVKSAHIDRSKTNKKTKTQRNPYWPQFNKQVKQESHISKGMTANWMTETCDAERHMAGNDKVGEPQSEPSLCTFNDNVNFQSKLIDASLTYNTSFDNIDEEIQDEFDTVRISCDSVVGRQKLFIGVKKRNDSKLATAFPCDDIDLEEPMSHLMVRFPPHKVKQEFVQSKKIDQSVQQVRQKVRTRRKRHQSKPSNRIEEITSIDKPSIAAITIQRGWHASKITKLISDRSATCDISFVVESDMVAEEVW